MLLTVGNMSTAWAAQRSLRQAKEIALQQAGKIGIDVNSSATGGMMSLQSQADDASYYVFSGAQDGGYVIVSGDDLMPDVVAYSTSGNFADATSMPTGFAAMLQAYDETVKAVQRGDARALKTVNEAKSLRETKTFKAVDPLLEREGIRWNQYAPYYNACPHVTDDEGNKTMCLTGCVATAMAQVMRYYKYPKATIAEIPAYTSSFVPSFDMPAIPAGTKFDWDNMLGTYKDGEYTKEQADAVAQLMLACGCAVKMQYGTAGSAADVYPQNLMDYFGYDKELVQHLYRNNFSAAQWTNIIDGELAAERPILYAGDSFNSGNGHQFVLDGADGNGLYHINWGWGGDGDNYFDIAVLNPKNTAGQVGDPNGYTVKANMIIGITPDNGRVDEPLVSVPVLSVYSSVSAEKEVKYPLTLELTKADRTDEKSPFTIAATVSYWNVTTNVYNGYVGLGIPNGDDDSFTCLQYIQVDDLEFGWLDSENFTVDYAFPVGTTELWAVYSEDGQTWKPCALNGTSPFRVSATATEAHVVQALDGTVEIEGDLYQGVPSTATFTLHNNMDNEYIGTMYMFMTDEELNSKLLYAMTVTVPGGESTTHTVTIEPSQVGKPTFCLTDYSGHDLYTKQVEVKQAEEAKYCLTRMESNITSGKTAPFATYFTEGYNSKVMLPVLEDDTLRTTWYVKNDGATPVKLEYTIDVRNLADNKLKCYKEGIIRLESTETKLSYNISKDVVESNCLWVHLDYMDRNVGDYVDMPTILPDNTYTIVSDDPAYTDTYTVKGNSIFVYIAGNTTSIAPATATAAGTSVAGGNGQITVVSDSAKRVAVYSISGMKTAELTLTAGQPQTIVVAPGLYIVEGTKVVVR